MKVYDYLALATMSLPKNDKKIFKESFQLQLHIVNKLNLSIEDFYNLPFTPKLITKFFKGWEVIKENYEIVNMEKGYGVVINDDYVNYYAGQKERVYLHRSPIVLNDFIRDCKRAGIELELK